jgi:hypothetical protein
MPLKIPHHGKTKSSIHEKLDMKNPKALSQNLPHNLKKL